MAASTRLPSSSLACKACQREPWLCIDRPRQGRVQERRPLAPACRRAAANDGAGGSGGKSAVQRQHHALLGAAVAGSLSSLAAAASAAEQLAGTSADAAAALAAAAAAAAASASFQPGPVEVGWEIWVGFIAGVVPFIIATVEFSKRVIIQRRCAACSGRGLVQRGRVLRKCTECGGLLPWLGWRQFFFSTAAPGNGGPLMQPKGQTSVFYRVPPKPSPAAGSGRQEQQAAGAQAGEQAAEQQAAAPAAGAEQPFGQRQP